MIAGNWRTRKKPTKMCRINNPRLGSNPRPWSYEVGILPTAALNHSSSFPFDEKLNLVIQYSSSSMPLCCHFRAFYVFNRWPVEYLLPGLRALRHDLAICSDLTRIADGDRLSKKKCQTRWWSEQGMIMNLCLRFMLLGFVRAAQCVCVQENGCKGDRGPESCLPSCTFSAQQDFRWPNRQWDVTLETAPYLFIETSQREQVKERRIERKEYTYFMYMGFI